MKKFLLLALMACAFIACDKKSTSRNFEGVWEPVGYEECDQFVITSDSIKAIRLDNYMEHYQCHYTILRDSIVELERCWMVDATDNGNASSSDYTSEVYMYIDKDKYLIIRNFLLESELSQMNPNYTHLKLKKK